MANSREIPFGIKLIVAPVAFCCLLFICNSSSQAQIVKRVIDGDTIQLGNGEMIKLIGVDTPETKHPQKPVEYYGKEAYTFTRKMVEGQQVRIEYAQQKKDKYGRTPAYVYLTDGTFLNAEIIKQGYGHAYIAFPFKYLEQFRQYEKDARNNKLGLWAAKPKEPEKKLIKEKYVGSKFSNKYHFSTCTSAQRIKPANRRVFYSVKKAVDAGYVPCKSCRPPYYK